jgi:hypothetical protein
MSGRRLRRATAAAALGLGGALCALLALRGFGLPLWGVPFVVAGALVVGELLSLCHDTAPTAAVERAAVGAALRGVVVVALLAGAGASVALLAAAAPARHGLGAGLLGAGAAAALFLLVAAVARRSAGPPARG